MPESIHLNRICAVQQRIALLKQQERELMNSFSQSHATRDETEEIEAKLVALAAEIAELESVISTRGEAKTA